MLTRLKFSDCMHANASDVVSVVPSAGVMATPKHAEFRRTYPTVPQTCLSRRRIPQNDHTNKNAPPPSLPICSLIAYSSCNPSHQAPTPHPPALRHSVSMGFPPHASAKPRTLSKEERSHTKDPAAPDASAAAFAFASVRQATWTSCPSAT